MPRPIYARIDQDALENNLRVARRTAPSSRIMAVIKADAYGHGLMRAAEALAGADGFALLDIRDAVKLREAGFRQRMLLLEGAFDADDLAACAEYELAGVVHSDWQLNLLESFPAREKLDVWLKLNSGMHRLGFAPEQYAPALERLRRMSAVREVTLMSHFANADEAAGVSGQLELFKQVAGQHRYARSLANSAALLRYPETHGDWVRPGIMLYGASPFEDRSARDLGLRPAMTLGSRIIATQQLRSGDAIGYGSTFRAEHSMRVGVVACGYADGYPRHASTGTPVLVDGRRTRVLGRVSMDMLYVDLADLPDAGVGAPVTLWGEGLPVEEVARAAGTISYELMCALTARVPVVL